MKADTLLSIIIPVKNEQDNIAWTIGKIKKTVTVDNEIIIIYDSPNDNTLPIVKKLKKTNSSLVLIKNANGNGVLNAIKTGIAKARGRIIVIMAADRTDDPKAINKMYQKIIEGYDIVCPTRYSRGGKVIGPINVKSLLSRVSGITTPYLLGIPTSDLTYSFKMFRKQILDKITIESKGGFEFAEELLIKSHFSGAKIIEIPTLWVDRKYGQSKFKLVAWLPRYIYWYLWGIVKRLESLPIFRCIIY
jgi:glycosyltransferase involved in cell wall biosynthesis